MHTRIFKKQQQKKSFSLAYSTITGDTAHGRLPGTLQTVHLPVASHFRPLVMVLVDQNIYSCTSYLQMQFHTLHTKHRIVKTPTESQHGKTDFSKKRWISQLTFLSMIPKK